MLVWALDMGSPFKQLVAATVCTGCALLLASVALQRNGKPALPPLTDLAESTTLWMPELREGTENPLQLLADFADGVCVVVVACALFHLPQTSATSPWIAETHDWTEEEEDKDRPTASSALHAAAWLGHEGAVRLLLEQGEGVSATTDNGAAPLFYM